MKKKLFFVLMICILAAVATCALAGCKNDKLPHVRNLSVTDDGYLSWGAVEGADGYVVYFNDDESNRFYLEDTSISLDNPEIRSSLISGQKNNVYIRAVTLNAKKIPDKSSDRSLIIFNYSRKLETPNKVKMTKERFSWRGVLDAEDYKAYVRRSGDTEGKLYDMDWKTGAAAVTGTIKDLPNGSMYYVSIVATAAGFENSDPSVEVPYDRTVVSVDTTTYTAYVGDATYNLSADPDNANLFTVTFTARAGDALRVEDNSGKAYTVDTQQLTANSDYVLTLDVAAGTAKVQAFAAYYLYVNGGITPAKFFFNAETGVYVLNVTLADGDNYVVKDGEGNLVTAYSDDSVGTGNSSVAGEYALRIARSESGEGMVVTVKTGTATDTGSSTPVSYDGKWAVTFDYNYPSAPTALVAYADDNRPVARPATPLRAGYTFVGWYFDSYGYIEAEFSKQSYFPITCPTILYAKWSKDEPIVVEHTKHVDADGDGKCDVCGGSMATPCTKHVDANGDGKCDKCSATMPTAYCTKHWDANGDGKCDKCGVLVDVVDVPVDTTGYIYFDVSKYSWFADNDAVIKMYVWYADGSNNGFPGDTMTVDAATGYYKVAYYANRGVKGVLFTRNNPKNVLDAGETSEWNRVEVSGFTFDANYPVYRLLTYTDTAQRGEWVAYGTTTPDQPITNPDGKIYLDYLDVPNYTEGGSINMIYIWYTDGTENNKFPGVEMTYTLHAGYVGYYTTKTVGGVIFTRNNPDAELSTGVWNRIDITFDGTFDPAKPAYRLVSMGATNDGYWESEADALATQPAPPVDEADNILTFYVNLDAITWYGDDNAVVKALITYADGTVNAANGVAGELTDGLYGWKYNADKAIADVSISRYVDGVSYNAFSVALSTDAEKNVIVVTSINGIVADYTYVAKGEDIPAPEMRTVYFKDNWLWAEERGPIYAYVFDGGEPKNWPGEAMTYVADADGYAIYSYTFSTAYRKIIFAAYVEGGAANAQTVDITLGVDNAYSIESWQDEGNRKANVSTWTYSTEPAVTKTVASITAEYTGGSISVGTVIALSDVKVTATYVEEGVAAEIITSGYLLSDYDINSVGEQSITVTYKGVSSDPFIVTYVASVTPEMRTVYFKDNWLWAEQRGPLYAHVYNGEGAEDEWPGKAMTYIGVATDGKAVYSYTFSNVYTGLVISTKGEDANNNAKTDDITISESTAYEIQNWQNEGERIANVQTWAYDATAILTGITATYEGTVQQGSAIDADALTVTATYAAGNSATITEGYALGDYAKTEGEQTITVTYLGISIPFTVTYVASEVSTTRTVYFKDNWLWAEQRGPIYAYVFKGENYEQSWPGTAMADIGKYDDNYVVYSYTFSTEYTHIVIAAYAGDNDLNNAQTVNIELGSSTAYEISGWDNEGSKIANVQTWEFDQSKLSTK